MDPLGAVLLAGAAYCLEHKEREWWDADAIPFESAFSMVEGFGQTNTELRAVNPARQRVGSYY